MTDSKPTFTPHLYNDVLVIGAGFSGLTAVAKLQKAGFNDVHVYERWENLGGTWWINQYPGAACDVPSALYSLSFAQKPNWTCAMPSDLEIRTYLNGVAEQYNFNAKTTYKTNVEKAIWMDEIKRWKVYLRDRDTNTGYIHECKILLSCAGLFGTPNWPEIPGRETFKGVQMHSARWDKSVDLKGKRVTVFGNGCTAAQIVPAIAPEVAEVNQIIRNQHYIQRPAPIKYNHITNWIFSNIPGMMELHRLIIFLGAEVAAPLQYTNIFAERFRKVMQKKVIRYMKAKAPKEYHNILIPDFQYFCKRRIMDPGYLVSLNRPNVHLLEAKSGVTISPDGVETPAGKIPTDIIVYATGFTLSKFLTNMQIIGRTGETIDEHFEKLGGPGAYNCCANHKFPNFFMSLGPNTATGHTSALIALENAINYAILVATPVLRGEADEVEVTAEAEKSYVNSLQTAVQKRVWSTGCSNWYLNNKGWNATAYPWTQAHYWYHCSFVKKKDWNITWKSTPKPATTWSRLVALVRALVKLGLLGIVLSAVWLRVGGKIRGLDEKAMKMMVAGKLLGMVGKVFTSKAILGRAAGELRGVWV